MRISASSASAIGRDTSIARRAIAGSFSLADALNAAPRAGLSQMKAVGGIDTLMALQAFDDTTERRKRAVRKGRTALDVLESLKVGLLSGDLGQSTLNRLRAIAEDLGEPTGDSGLDAVMAEIDLRVQVEIAKLSRR